MIFFRLTQNYSNNLPVTNEEWKEYKSTKLCVRCNQSLIDGKCQACTEFGPIDQATILYQLNYQKYPCTKEQEMGEVNLTALQQKASDFIINNAQTKEVLIWAVCGSGKTEISFAIIRKYLNCGEYIAFVIPRKDILNEIAHRLLEVFPGLDLVMMSSEHKQKRDGQVYVLTPNQLLRFKQAFSLIICDEIDAYPFMEDPRFIFAVESARRPSSSTCFLTSTPSEEFLKRDLAIFTIYERWHQHDLPQPVLLYQNRFFFRHRIIREPLQQILANKRQCLLFIGLISAGIDLERRMQKWGYNCRFVYAQDQARSQKIAAFRSGAIDILITTTILERGVTFTGIDVIVLDADNYIYNVAALVQIAGRVNRKLDDQLGVVYFCFERMTKTIEKACEQITAMNYQKRQVNDQGTQWALEHETKDD